MIDNKYKNVVTEDENAVVPLSSSSLEEEVVPFLSSSLGEEQNRKPPFWMEDYVNGEGLSGSEADENLTHFALFANTDPMSFEEVVKSED